MKRIEFTISLAGLPIRIRTSNERLRRTYKDFIVEDDVQPEIVVDISREDVIREECRVTGAPIEDCTGHPYYEDTALFRKIAEALVPFSTILMHGSAISLDGEVYIFTAPSGTGKSTHTRLWREYFGERAVMVNDDKPLLKIEDDQILVCGNPWNGKHHLGENVMLPLKAICYLERNDSNSISRLSSKAAFECLFKQIYRPENFELMSDTMKCISIILERIPVYKMGVNNLKEDAVRVSYEGMRDTL